MYGSSLSALVLACGDELAAPRFDPIDLAAPWQTSTPAAENFEVARLDAAFTRAAHWRTVSYGAPQVPALAQVIREVIAAAR